MNNIRSSFSMRKDYRINKIKIEVEILESKIKQFSEKKINSEQLLKSVDDFKHALWKLV